MAIIAVDFDVPIHRYGRGWHDGTVYDDLTPGAKEALGELAEDHELVVFTARPNIELISPWLDERGMLDLFSEATRQKPRRTAVLIDDRAIRFKDWKSALAITKRLVGGSK